MSHLLHAEGLEIGYGDGASVVEGLGFDLAAGETIGLLGPNGAGKTTVVRGLMGLLPLRSGRVQLDGMNLAALEAAARTLSGLVCVPEGRALFDELTVHESLELAGRRLGRRERRRVIDEQLERFRELAARRESLTGTLSGGEQQMLALARALMLKPRVLIIDEPSLGLSRSAVDRLAEALRILGKEGTAILIADQERNLSLALAQRAIILDVGRAPRPVSVAQLRSEPSFELEREASSVRPDI